jgi:hypothetical protein
MSIDILSSIALSHGQTRWLMNCLDLSDGDEGAFNSYMKFLRRNGVPFSKGETPGGPGTNVSYDYYHLMELALALTLHRQAILKRDVVGLLVSMRKELRPLFQRAWLESDRDHGERVPVKIGTGNTFKASGLWLDLGLNYSEVGYLSTTEPKLLNAEEAIRLFCTLNRQSYFRDPIRISDLAKRVVELVPDAPKLRRGPK